MTIAEVRIRSQVKVHHYGQQKPVVEDVWVRVSLERRLPLFKIGETFNAASREQAERIRMAITGAGFEFPRLRVLATIERLPETPQGRIADQGSCDAAIALGVLLTSLQIDGAPEAAMASGARVVGHFSKLGRCQISPVEGLAAPVIGDLRDLASYST